MEPSQAPHESPAKVADKEVEPGSLSRFKALAGKLLAVKPDALREALAESERERRARRGP